MTYTPEQLSDREKIREAAMRYSYGVDRLDPDVMKSAYWPEATDDHGNFVGNAHEFVDYCMEAHLRWKWTMHSIYNHQIELEDDGIHARGEIYNISHLCRKGTNIVDTWFGRYLDKYEKRGEDWKIIERVCVHNGSQVIDAVPMRMQTSAYRRGSFDRPANGRPIGP